MPADRPVLSPDGGLGRRQRRTAFACAGFVAGMVGAAYAAVPLYDLFCRATGFGGTPSISDTEAGEVVDRPVTVLFDANVAPGLAWRFAPETPQVTVKPGVTTTVFYRVTNTGTAPATGIASYNIQPERAGGYFVKMQCFCFTDRVLQPGESLDSAVVFYVDPAITRDEGVSDLDTLTLSYTYFPAKGGRPVAEAATSARTKTP